MSLGISREVHDIAWLTWERRSDLTHHSARKVAVVAQDWAVAFYHSPAWRRNRRAYLERVIDTPYGLVPPMMCERCYANGKLVPAKVVHHVIHLTPQNIDDPHVSLSFDNFQRLCQDCHAFVHTGYEPPRYTFDSDGNLVEREDT